MIMKSEDVAEIHVSRDVVVDEDWDKWCQMLVAAAAKSEAGLLTKCP